MRRRIRGGPRAWRTRADREMAATGWSESEVHLQIIKRTWTPMGEQRPAWAEAAYDRHWITLAAYLQIPNEPGKSAFDLIYAESPLYRLLKKEGAA